MASTNSNDRCNSNNLFYSTTCLFPNSTEWARKETDSNFVFPRTAEEASAVVLPMATTHSSISYPKSVENASHHRLVLRSYSCFSSNEGSKNVSSLLASAMKRRLPLGSLATRGAFESSSTRQKAVLPKRKRSFTGERHPKRFCRSADKHDPNKSLAQRRIQDTNEGGKLSQKFLRRQCFGVHSSSCCTRTEESKMGINTNDDIDSSTIFRQLNILKRGGYWKHLPREHMQEEDHHRDEERLVYEERLNRSFVRKEENKENLPRERHPNTGIAYEIQVEWEDEVDDDEDYYGEEESNRNTADQFVGSALATYYKTGMMGDSIGFRVYAITEDGWMCCSEQFHCGTDTIHCEGTDETSTTNENANQQQQQQQSLVLLHLPTKVAALGRQGMFVRGMDLMKRRENGVIEPHTHCVTTIGRSNGNGFSRGASATTTDHLFGIIML